MALRWLLYLAALPDWSFVTYPWFPVSRRLPPIVRSSFPEIASIESRNGSAPIRRLFMRHCNRFSGSNISALESLTQLIWYALEDMISLCIFLMDQPKPYPVWRCGSVEVWRVRLLDFS